VLTVKVHGKGVAVVEIEVLVQRLTRGDIAAKTD
jgi:hypothetical protein